MPRGAVALPPPKIYRAKPHVITTVDELKGAVEFYLDQPEFVFDVETKGPDRGNPILNEVFWMTLAGPGRVDVIPMQHPTGDIIDIEIPMRKDGKGPLKNARPIPHFGPPPKQLWQGDVFSALEPLFFSEDIRKVGHNVKFDLRSIAKYYGGEVPPPPYSDTLIGEHMVWENYRGNRPYALNNCVYRRFRYTYDKEIRKELEIAPFSEAASYCYLDGKWTWLLNGRVQDDLDAEGLLDLFEFEMKVLNVVIAIEQRGADIDLDAIADLDELLTEEIEKAYAIIYKALGHDINMNADAQVRELVYEVRGHKPVMFTEKGNLPATSAKALERYRHRDPVVNAVLDWADLHKLQATFVQGLQEKLIDGRIHTEFDQRGTVTGRFSSRNPNLQNIPVRSERGRKIRELFIPPPGYKLIIADYSQIELRMLAHYCQDPVLMQAYIDGLDLHMITARRGYHTENPTYEQRARAKNVNFSMVFGATAMTLVERYGIPTVREAEALIEAFFSTYKKVDPWRRAVIQKARKNFVSRERARQLGIAPCPPYVQTILGRKRRLPELVYPDMGIRRRAERQAINTVIQGSAADINKVALVEIHEAFKDRDMHIVLTVHDEAVAVVPEAEADEAAILVREAMEGAIQLRVPLVADVKVADQWSEK